jgi:hypothetical protein
MTDRPKVAILDDYNRRCIKLIVLVSRSFASVMP